MANTYNVLAKIVGKDEINSESTHRVETTDTAYTEEVSYTYVVPASSTNLALPFGGLANADVVLIQGLTPAATWSVEFNTSGTYNISFVGTGFIMVNGATIDSIGITTTADADATIKVTAFD